MDNFEITVVNHSVHVPVVPRTKIAYLSVNVLHATYGKVDDDWSM